jgi:hypothetical protein
LVGDHRRAADRRVCFKAINPAAADGLPNGNPGQLFNQFMAVLITLVFAKAHAILERWLMSWSACAKQTMSARIDLTQHGEMANPEEATT